MHGGRLARRFELAGWVLFIISAIGFILSSLRSGDVPGLVGGVFFLLACFVFLVPFFLPRDHGG